MSEVRRDRVGVRHERVEGIQNLKMKKMRVDNHIHNIVISYLAKYEPLTFRRLKVRKNFGNSSSLIFKGVYTNFVFSLMKKLNPGITETLTTGFQKNVFSFSGLITLKRLRYFSDFVPIS